MAIYTGTLTDVGVNALGPLVPRLTVRPEVEAFGPDGPVTDNRVVVPLSGTTFSMELIPTIQLRAPGYTGVKYILEVVLFAATADGSTAQVWHSEWRFTALPGGGPIADMGDAPAIGFFAGPPWPSRQIPGIYFDITTGDLGKYEV